MGGDVLRHTANLDLLVSGMCGLFRLGLNCSRWPLSRVESGAKPPGETQNGVSPGPPRASVQVVLQPQWLEGTVIAEAQIHRASNSQFTVFPPLP